MLHALELLVGARLLEPIVDAGLHAELALAGAEEGALADGLDVLDGVEEAEADGGEVLGAEAALEVERMQRGGSSSGRDPLWVEAEDEELELEVVDESLELKLADGRALHAILSVGEDEGDADDFKDDCVAWVGRLGLYLSQLGSGDLVATELEAVLVEDSPLGDGKLPRVATREPLWLLLLVFYASAAYLHLEFVLVEGHCSATD